MLQGNESPTFVQKTKVIPALPSAVVQQQATPITEANKPLPAAKEQQVTIASVVSKPTKPTPPTTNAAKVTNNQQPNRAHSTVKDIPDKSEVVAKKVVSQQPLVKKQQSSSSSSVASSNGGWKSAPSRNKKNNHQDKHHHHHQREQQQQENKNEKKQAVRILVIKFISSEC